jgi:hypothetical protein
MRVSTSKSHLTDNTKQNAERRGRGSKERRTYQNTFIVRQTLQPDLQRDFKPRLRRRFQQRPELALEDGIGAVASEFRKAFHAHGEEDRGFGVGRADRVRDAVKICEG